MSDIEILNGQGEWVSGSPDEAGQRFRKVISFSGNKTAYIESVFNVDMVDTKITRKAFLSRFTDDEAATIDLASIDIPSETHEARMQRAKLRHFFNKVQASTYIDLADSETVDGINALVGFGVLASERAYAILNNPIDESEKP